MHKSKYTKACECILVGVNNAGRDLGLFKKKKKGVCVKSFDLILNAERSCDFIISSDQYQTIDQTDIGVGSTGTLW